MQAKQTKICGQALPRLRPPDEVMKLSRLGSFFPHRLSFMRTFIRRVAAEDACMTVTVNTLDQNGYGHVVLSCLLYTSPSPRDRQKSRMPSSA